MMRVVLVAFLAVVLIENARSESMGILIIRNTDTVARVTQRCQKAKDLRITRNPRNYAKPHSLGYRREAHRRWHNRRRACQEYIEYPPHYSAWLCIHKYEAAWDDTGAPYWGGLQFGYNEWQRFGKPYTGVETANLASPIQQMWAAERYRRLSGFYPWPNTARKCGLL